MNNNNRTNKTLNVRDLMVEVFGESYATLLDKRELPPEESLRNAKLTIIEDINKARKLMGCNVCVDKLFYDLYDMDIDTLQEAAKSYENDAYHYAREHGVLNSKL